MENLNMLPNNFGLAAFFNPFCKNELMENL